MRRLVVTLLGVLAMAAVAFLGYQRISAGSASRGAANEVQTAKVQRGTIIATVFAVGNVVPSREASLVFSTIGTVK